MLDFILFASTVSLVTFIIANASSFLITAAETSADWRALWSGILGVFFLIEVVFLVFLFQDQSFYDHSYLLDNMQHHLMNKFHSIRTLLTMSDYKDKARRNTEAVDNNVDRKKEGKRGKTIHEYIDRVLAYLEDFDGVVDRCERKNRRKMRAMKIIVIVETILSVAFTVICFSVLYYGDFGIHQEVYVKLGMFAVAYDFIAAPRFLYAVTQLFSIKRLKFDDKYKKYVSENLDKLQMQCFELMNLLESIDADEFSGTIGAIRKFYPLMESATSSTRTMRRTQQFASNADEASWLNKNPQFAKLSKFEKRRQQECGKEHDGKGIQLPGA
jgi:hypothetical protein